MAALRVEIDQLQGQAGELRAAAAADAAQARDRLAPADDARAAAARRAAAAERTAAEEAEARRAAEGGLRGTLERLEAETTLRARADADAERLRGELEGVRADALSPTPGDSATIIAAMSVCIFIEGFVGKVDDGQHAGRRRGHPPGPGHPERPTVDADRADHPWPARRATGARPAGLRFRSCRARPPGRQRVDAA